MIKKRQNDLREAQNENKEKHIDQKAMQKDYKTTTHNVVAYLSVWVFCFYVGMVECLLHFSAQWPLVSWSFHSERRSQSKGTPPKSEMGIVQTCASNKFIDWFSYCGVGKSEMETKMYINVHNQVLKTTATINLFRNSSHNLFGINQLLVSMLMLFKWYLPCIYCVVTKFTD